MLLNLDIKEITAPRHSLYHVLRFIAQGITNLDQALRQRVFCYNNICPDGRQYFILAEQYTMMFNQVGENLKTLGCLALLFVYSSVMADGHLMDSTTDRQAVFTFTSDPQETGGYSNLTRTDGMILIALEAAGLTPGNVHTLWWIVFNNPEACSEDCGENDIFDLANEFGGACDGLNCDGVVAAGIAIGNATGNVAKSDGTLEFGARMPMGSNADGHQVLFGAGFGPIMLTSSPHDAEVHVIVQSHGQARGNKQLMQQLSLVDSNCTPRCADLQATIHKP